jgi:hypothetical protein
MTRADLELLTVSERRITGSLIIIIINLETIPGKHSTDSLQKTAVLGTSHFIKKALQ